MRLSIFPAYPAVPVPVGHIHIRFAHNIRWPLYEDTTHKKNHLTHTNGSQCVWHVVERRCVTHDMRNWLELAEPADAAAAV